MATFPYFMWWKCPFGGRWVVQNRSLKTPLHNIKMAPKENTFLCPPTQSLFLQCIKKKSQYPILLLAKSNTYLKLWFFGQLSCRRDANQNEPPSVSPYLRFSSNTKENNPGKKSSGTTERKLESKMLVLGPANAGKSTLIRNLRLIHNDTFTEDEILCTIKSIRSI